MHKKIISGICAAAFCLTSIISSFSVSAVGRNAAASVSSVNGTPGETVTVDISLTENPGMTSIYFMLGYDEDTFELINVTDKKLWGSSPVYDLNRDSNPIILSWIDGLGDYSATGTMASVDFKIKDTAVGGDYTISLSTNDDNNMNNDLDLVSLSTVDGKITVKKSENTDTVVNPVIQNVTADGFVIKAQSGYEYYVSETNSIPDGAVWTADTVVTGKIPNTTYYVFGRIAATNTVEASAPSASTSVKVPNNDASLKSLNVAAGTISPAFVPTTYDYTVTVPYGGSISDAVVVPNDTNASYEFTKTASDFGVNNITEITVTAENGVDTKVYTVTYSEINAVLSAFTVNGASVTGFNPDTTSYTYAVPYAAWKADSAKTYAIVATASKDTSTVVISDNNFVLTSTDSDENADKNVTVTVTAEGGETTTYTIKFTVLACPHSNATITPGTAADCTNDGSEIYECPDCGKSETRVITALGHDWDTEWTEDIPATCTTDGSKSHHCSRCDAKNDITVINALGHIWNRWASVEGTENYERTCSRCNTTETKTAADISHEHVFNGETEIITPPTCTAEGLQKVWCSVESCPEFVEESVNKAPHTEGAPIVINATCFTEGSSTIKCTVCGETLSTSVLPKTDHSYGTAWEKNENGHWNTCSVCGENSDVEAHIENEGVITTPATNTENGVKTYSCKVCGYEMRTEVIPATGDNSFIDYPTGGYTGAPVIPFGGTTTESLTVKVENKITGKTNKVIAQKNGNSVSVKLGTENNGYYANVYTTNDEYIYSALIRNGRARFNVPDDVKIKVVIDSIAYGEDVSSAAAYNYDANKMLSDNVMTYFISIILLIGTSVIMVFISKNQAKK